MKKSATFLITVCLLLLCVFNYANNQNELKIWKEFVATLMNNEMTLERIRPYEGLSKETFMGWLNIVKEKASLKELQAEPEFHIVDNKVHFIIPLSFEAPNVNYCFSFIIEGDKWYFHHLETISIRLDKITSLPTSTFPDLTESEKAWIREEIRTSEQVRLFNLLAREKGRDFAFSWFKDGAGYFLAAQAWVPFMKPAKAFILYVCWEQANLGGNEVTLEKLEDNEAVVKINPLYFQIFRAAEHLKKNIAFEDYHKIFDIIWQDRARNAGWKLEITHEEETYKGEKCLFHFIK